MMELRPCTVDDLLAVEDEMIRRIRLCFGVDGNTFEQQAMRPLRRLAAYVLNLPASPGEFLAGPGGMFKLAVEVAFYCLQGTDAHIFAGRSTISARRLLEPRWRLATFLAGLCSTLETAATQLVVQTPTGSHWPALRLPLADWVETNRFDALQVRWHLPGQESVGGGLLVVALVIPPDLLDHLDQGDGQILPAMLESIGGLPRLRMQGALPSLVRRSFALVVEQHREQQPPGHAPAWPVFVQRDVIDTLRRLAATDSRWVPNRDKSRVWDRDGVHLVWPQAGIDVLEALEEQALAGMPQTIDELLELLLEAGAVREDVLVGGDRTSSAGDGAPPQLGTLRLSDAAVLYPSANGAARVEHAPGPVLADRLAIPTPAGPASSSPPDPPPSPGVEPGSDVGRPLHTPDAEPASVPPEPTETAEQAPSFGVTLPLRLDRAVARALADIAADPARFDPGPRLSSDGLAVPLDAFRTLGVEPQLALRALEAAGMLARAGRGRLTADDAAGKPTTFPALMIAPTYVSVS